MVAPLVALFDIDGTLIDADGAGRRAIEAAMDEVVGPDHGLGKVRFAGMTDPAIVAAGLVAAGLAVAGRAADDALVARVLAAYIERLPVELARTPPRIHPGVIDILDWLGVQADVAIGLGTGNVEPGAQAKLQPVDLWKRFAFGGFGSDHADRATLIGIGADRGAARLGRPRAQCRVVVIGDTPRDVAAARAIGARSLGVGTAWHPAAELRAAGATWAVDDLTATQAREALLCP